MPPSFKIGDMEVFPDDHKIVHEDGEIPISPIALDIIYELAAHGGKPISRDSLISQIWGSKPPSTGTLSRQITLLNHDLLVAAGGIDVIEVSNGTYALNLKVSGFGGAGSSEPGLQGTETHQNRIEWFLAELNRRKVSQTGVLYLVASWLLLQFSDAAFDALGLGTESVQLLLITAVIGFPITLLLSWFYDVKPANGKQTSENSSRRVGYVLAGALVAIPFAIAYQWYYTDDLSSARDTNSSSTLGEYVPEPNSIAVLAFENLGESENDDYLGDGIAEEIINALSSTRKLLVAPRTSSFLYKDNATDIREIGKQLGVRYVLEGSVRRFDGRVRVIATLVNITEGFQTWSNSYNQSMSDIFDVQQDISQKVVQSLDILLSSETANALGAARTANIEAYDFYLRGREYINRPVTQASLNGAIGLFNQSIELDPDYSDAYAGLCEAYLKQYVETNTIEWFEKAERTCTETLRFDLKTVELRVALGNLYLQSGEYESAQRQLQIALDRDPADINAISALAKTYREMNKLEAAEALFVKAIKLQPRFWKSQEQYGNFLFETGRPEEAITYYRAAIEMTPDNAAAYNGLGAAFMMSSQFDEAAAAWKESLRIEDNESASSNAGTALFLAGKFDEAAAMYQRAIQISRDKHILWGNHADALWFGSTPEAAEDSYRTAVRLAEESLEVNKNDRVTLATLAHYYSRLGQRDVAMRHLESATAEDTSNVYVWYYAAVTWLTLDRVSLAVQSLKKAMEMGYPKEIVLSDAGLKKLTSSAEHRAELGF